MLAARRSSIGAATTGRGMHPGWNLGRYYSLWAVGSDEPRNVNICKSTLLRRDARRPVVSNIGKYWVTNLRLGLRPLSYSLLLLRAVGAANRVQRIIEATAGRRRRLRCGHSVFRSVQHGSRARWCSFRGMNVSRSRGQAASGLLTILLRFKEECHRKKLYHKSS